MYEYRMKEIDQAKINIDKIENLGKDPEYFIYEYFEEIKDKLIGGEKT